MKHDLHDQLLKKRMQDFWIIIIIIIIINSLLALKVRVPEQGSSCT